MMLHTSIQRNSYLKKALLIEILFIKAAVLRFYLKRLQFSRETFQTSLSKLIPKRLA